MKPKLSKSERNSSDLGKYWKQKKADHILEMPELGVFCDH